MGEGLARSLLGHEHAIASAGSAPARVNPLAIEAMAEVGIDITHHSSKAMNSLPLNTFDVIITLCEGEVCPIVPGAKMLHWPIPDPAAAQGDNASRLAAFRLARETICARIRKHFLVR